MQVAALSGNKGDTHWPAFLKEVSGEVHAPPCFAPALPHCWCTKRKETISVHESITYLCNIIIDKVSTVKELAKRWYPDKYEQAPK